MGAAFLSAVRELTGMRSARGGSATSWRHAGAWAAAGIALGAILNTYSYTLVAAMPIIRSDGWRYLDGYLGRFLEHGFNWIDVFRQDVPADNNQPLQKLFLFLHTRWFGMDFSLDGLLGISAGILFVFALVRLASGRRPSRWGARELGLLAVLALTQLSLDSSELYLWPLVTEWFLPLLIASLYFGVALRWRARPLSLGVATFAVGMLIDEVAYPVTIAMLGGVFLAWRGRCPLRFIAACAGGLGASRLLYRAFNAGVVPIMQAMPRSFSPLVDPQAWKAVAIPLVDGLVQPTNLVAIAGSAAPALSNLLVLIFAGAHLVFWWRLARSDGGDATATGLAAALMLLCYGLVLGIVIQRVPTLGFDYLHQARYAMFYQLQFAALAMLVYRDWPVLRRRRIVLPAYWCVIVLLIALQWSVSLLAWKQVKYISDYEEKTAIAMGALARDPTGDVACTDVMVVCSRPPAKRAELIGRLQRYRMNVFSPEFQAFHRLYPYPREHFTQDAATRP